MKNVLALDSEYRKGKELNNDLLPYQFVMTYDNETSINTLIEESEKNSELYEHFTRMSKVRDIDTAYYSNQCMLVKYLLPLNKVLVKSMMGFV